MKTKILWVDDDPNLIAATQRHLRKDFDICAGYDAHQGLAQLKKNGPFAVVISDLRMPGVDGIEFLSEAHAIAPDTVRIMLTGFAEQDVAINAVNRGQIFRFLTKPSHPDDVRSALTAAAQHHQLVLAERELIEKTLLGSIRVMTDLLALTNPLAFHHVRQVKGVSLHVARSMRLPDIWKLEAAVILSQIGYITIPGETLQRHFRGKELSAQESSMMEAHPRICRDLLKHIPRLEDVAEIIAMSGKSRNTPAVEASKPLQLSANILRAAVDFERLLARGMSRHEALRVLRAHDAVYNRRVVERIAQARIDGDDLDRQCLLIDELKNGMMLDENVITAEQMLLAPKGLTINDAVRQRLRNFRLHDEIGEKVWVRIPAAKTACPPLEVAP